MPSNIADGDLKNYQASTLLIADEKNVLFPGEKVIQRAEKLIPNVQTHLTEDCGHLYFSSGNRKKRVGSIINAFLME